MFSVIYTENITLPTSRFNTFSDRFCPLDPSPPHPSTSYTKILVHVGHNTDVSGKLSVYVFHFNVTIDAYVST